MAIAILSGDGTGKQRTYSIMLESKSKEGDAGKIAAGDCRYQRRHSAPGRQRI